MNAEHSAHALAYRCARVRNTKSLAQRTRTFPGVMDLQGPRLLDEPTLVLASAVAFRRDRGRVWLIIRPSVTFDLSEMRKHCRGARAHLHCGQTDIHEGVSSSRCLSLNTN